MNGLTKEQLEQHIVAAFLLWPLRAGMESKFERADAFECAAVMNRLRTELREEIDR